MAVKFSDEEKEAMASAFERLNLKPKFDDPTELESWLAEYGGRVKSEPGVVDSAKQPHMYFKSPRITPFSGVKDPKEITYEAWKYEVLTLLQDKMLTPSEITIAAKKSLRGEAAMAVRHLGFGANIGSVLEKLDSIYGIVEQAEDLMENFYAAKQMPKESVASWSCRLEDLLYRSSEQNRLPGSTNDMLVSKFFSGLLPHLKEPARVKADKVKHFGELVVEVRKLECEQASSSSGPVVKPAHVKMTDAQSEEIEVKAMLLQITSRMDAIENKLNSSSVQSNPDQQFRSNYSRRSRGRFNRQVRGRGNRGRGSQKPVSHTVDRKEPTCHRCGQLGHLSYGCRVVLDDSLNEGESV